MAAAGAFLTARADVTSRVATARRFARAAMSATMGPARPGERLMSDTPARPALPEVRAIAAADIRASLAEGWRDFSRAPLISGFFGLVYAAGGIGLYLAASELAMGWIVYPMMLGFALIGPFVAVGLYEISRRLDRGERPGWGPVLSVIWAQRQREIAWMGFVMLFVLVVWMYQVRILIALFLGLEPFHGFEDMIRVLFTTQAGLTFLAVGHVIGAILALVVFSLTVVSIPLLLDRDVDIVTAMITSVKAVTTNAGVMLGWGLVVTALLFISAAPAFVGLIVSLPLLGHATWRLYRRVVVPA